MLFASRVHNELDQLLGSFIRVDASYGFLHLEEPREYLSCPSRRLLALKSCHQHGNKSCLNALNVQSSIRIPPGKIGKHAIGDQKKSGERIKKICTQPLVLQMYALSYEIECSFTCTIAPISKLCKSRKRGGKAHTAARR